MNTKFAICADVHTEFIHDAPERMKVFADACIRNNVDFCIQLGDFCPPGNMNLSHKKKIFEITDSLPMPFYHVLGNHDMDENCKESVLAYLNSDSAYYSFDAGETHFIVLDPCYIGIGNDYVGYDHGNYKTPPTDARVPVLPPHELEWLKNDLLQARYPSIIFSHQSLIESRAGILNAPEFRDTIKDAPKGVMMAICGHEHVDRMETRDGVRYWCVNSMSYYWAGSPYTHESYSHDIHNAYPLLKYVFPYKDPLYAIVTVTDSEISIKGTVSDILGAKPEQMNFKKPGLTDKITASIKNVTVALTSNTEDALNG